MEISQAMRAPPSHQTDFKACLRLGKKPRVLLSFAHAAAAMMAALYCFYRTAVSNMEVNLSVTKWATQPSITPPHAGHI